MNIDRERLRGDVAELARTAHALKKTLRMTWTRPMKDEQQKLVRLRRRATELCVLAAFLRGKHHVRAPLRDGAYPGMKWDADEWHARVAARVAKDYEVTA
jgi:hypothetical protein